MGGVGDEDVVGFDVSVEEGEGMHEGAGRGDSGDDVGAMGGEVDRRVGEEVVEVITNPFHDHCEARGEPDAMAFDDIGVGL